MSVQCQAMNQNNRRCRNKTAQVYPYCWIHLKSLDKLQIKQSRIQGAGKGLFYVGKTPVPPDRTITQYSSERITREGNPNSDYVLQISRNQFLDSDNKLNYAGRYINDSRNGQNNVRFGNGYNIREVNNRFVVPVRTTRRILPNTELLTSYGRRYWDN